MSRRQQVCVLPGDGIGVEVTDAVLPLFEALGLPIDLKFGDIGWSCWQKEGNCIPDKTWDLINESDATLLGAITSKPLREAEAELSSILRGTGRVYVSPVIQLRQKLGLFANVRPVTDVLGNNRYRFSVIRENTEGLYAGLDFASIPQAFEPILAERERNGAPWSRESCTDATMTVRLQTRADYCACSALPSSTHASRATSASRWRTNPTSCGTAARLPERSWSRLPRTFPTSSATSITSTPLRCGWSDGPSASG